MEERIPARLTAVEGRKFGLTVGLAFLVLASIAWWRGRVPAEVAFGGLGTLLVLGGLVVPARLGPVFRAWMGLARLMSKVTTPVFLGIVFYVILTPIGLLMRLFGAQPLRRLDRSSSGWVVRAPEARRRLDMQRQF